MKPNNPRTFGIILIALLTLFTNIANATNKIQCKSTDEATPNPLPRQINIDWTLTKDSSGYYLVLNFLQLGDKYPTTFLISLIKGQMIREQVNMTIDNKKIAMYKLTINGKPFKDCEIVIFERADGTGAYLGYFKYIPDLNIVPRARNHHWAVASDYYSNPDLDNGSFIDSYNFAGGLKYSKDPSKFQKLECNKLSD